MRLRPEDYADLARIVDEHHAALMVVLFGEDAVPKAWIDQARKLGLIKAGTKYPGIISGAYQYGALMSALNMSPSSAAGVSLAELRDRLARSPVPQTAVERLAAQEAAQHGAQRAVGLGNKAGARVGSALIEADAKLREQFKGIIRDAVAARNGDKEAQERMAERARDKGLDEDYFADSFREGVRRVASDIGHASDDWTRDLQRIAQTESHIAMQQGQADYWREHVGGKILVYRSTRPTACRYCVALYTQGGNPRVFELDRLEANGPDNHGRKAAEWQPVNGATHPWCFPAGVLVVTLRGEIPIETVRVGDFVLTHRGRWRRVTAALERAFAGELVVADGVPGVPDHPFLLRGGEWRGIGNANQGDHAMKALEVAFPNTVDAPSLVAEKRRLGVIFGLLGAAVVPSAAVHFDPDLPFWDRKVHEVAADLVVRMRRYAGGLKSIVDSALLLGEEAARHLGHAAAYQLFGLSAAAPCLVGVECAGLSLIGGHLGVHDSGGLFGRAGTQPSGADSICNGLARHPESFGDSQDRKALLEVEADDFFGSDGDTRRHSATTLAYVPVRTLERRPHVGRVFNLAVEEDESYIAGRFAVHNCSCVSVRLPRYTQMPKGWRHGDAAPSVVNPEGLVA